MRLKSIMAEDAGTALAACSDDSDSDDEDRIVEEASLSNTGAV